MRDAYCLEHSAGVYEDQRGIGAGKTKVLFRTLNTWNQAKIEREMEILNFKLVK
jgi:hypothetical protein